VDVNSVSGLYRLLGDDARLRLLRLLARERLNVTELTGILGIAQSGVSRHLGLLKDAGLVVEERGAGYTYFRLPDQPGSGPLAPLWSLLQTQFEARNGHDAAWKADDARLQEVLRLRKENFDTHGEAKQLVPGRSWAAWARALGHLLPPLVVADLGCGEGYLTLEASRWARRVIAIDRSTDVLKRARALARRRRVRNVVWRRGDIEQVPLGDASVDVALLSQALHHAEDPGRALAEAHRVLRPGGRVLVLDLREHDEGWVRERFGDRWLGFKDDRLAAHLKKAGFRDVNVSVGSRRVGDPFAVLVASGTRK
jgi:SAM-dependent methyltransferase/biotin operon repressor